MAQWAHNSSEMCALSFLVYFIFFYYCGVIFDFGSGIGFWGGLTDSDQGFAVGIEGKQGAVVWLKQHVSGDGSEEELFGSL